MPITSAVGLVDAVRRFGLLAPPHAEELLGLQPRFADARSLAKELLQRGWLTPYQINQLVAGNGCNLVLGQYVLLERIGEGGMGQVLKARHQRLERIVALKLIRKERLAGRDAVQRFQREARAAARLTHPNLVTVYDADEVGGTHFFAMEYVEGTDLAKLVRKQGPLPVREACDYIRQAALGLQHAHEQGLVHRDIKPANLMLTTKGVVKVLDLGLARLEGVAETGVTVDEVTREGTVMGTPDYMAPEQATDSHSADIRADLYSLGCTLFQLLTGKVPYPGGTLTEKLLKHQLEPIPRVETLRPEVPLAFSAVLYKLMAKKPAERYRTPAELVVALGPFCENQVPVAISVGATVAYTPEEQSHQHTQTEGVTVARAKPVAVPVATVALAAAKPSSRDWLKSARRRPWLMADAGVAVAVLLVWLIVWAGSHRSDDGSQGSPPDSGNQAEGKPGQAPSFDGRWIAGMKRDPLPYEKYQEPLPPEVVGCLGDLWGRHWASVLCAAYRPDGSLAASGGNDGLIRLWDGKTLERAESSRDSRTPSRSPLTARSWPPPRAIACGSGTWKRKRTPSWRNMGTRSRSLRSARTASGSSQPDRGRSFASGTWRQVSSDRSNSHRASVVWRCRQTAGTSSPATRTVRCASGTSRRAGRYAGSGDSPHRSAKWPFPPTDPEPLPPAAEATVYGYGTSKVARNCANPWDRVEPTPPTAWHSPQTANGSHLP